MLSAQRLVILDPAGRTASEVCAIAARAGIAPVVVADAAMVDVPSAAVILVPPSAADAVGEVPATVPRWIYGEAGGAARLAAAAVACGASGVVLLPSRPAVMQLLVSPPPPPLPEVDLARARSLIAVAILDGNGEPTPPGLSAIARAFAADDCTLWWREGDGMVPWSARSVDAAHLAVIGAAARISAATGLPVLASIDTGPIAIAAAPLAISPQEVTGLIAVVSDRVRRYSPAELTDLRALASRLPRELTFRAGHRRLMSDHERLASVAAQDPLTGALSRAAFDREVTAAVAASSRRGEALALALFDVAGMRRINLEHGHRTGDEVLAAVTARLRAHVRGADRVGRFGGDELAVLLVGCSGEQARAAAAKLSEHVGATPITVGDVDIHVTLHAAVTGLGSGERSGEAGFSRLRQAVRNALPGEVVVAGRMRSEGEAAFEDESGGATTGTTLGGTYRILHELSRGAMGVVYRGDDLGLSRQVAIKVLRSDLASDAQLVTKFRAEAAMLAALQHHNLVQVYSLGEHEGDVYFVMELVEGQSLAEVVDRSHGAGQWLPFEAIAQIVLEIGDALDAMHTIGLIHRDVKPANVLLDRERDRAVLVDVGVAKRRGDEVDGAGTPGYAAPESFLEGSSESPETDVYGLAATMYYAVTGKPPFGAGQLMQVLTRQLHDPLTLPSDLRPGLSAAVDQVMAKALDPDPHRRYASASTFAVALTRALERGPRAAEVEPARPSGPAAVLKQTELLSGPRPGSTPLGPNAGMVRAAHFRVAARVIAHLAGDPAVRALSEADPALASALAPSLSPMGWLPLELLCELVEQATVHTRKNRPADGGEMLMRAIGRSTISATFSRFFGADPTTLGVVSVLSVLPTMWNRYHGWCRIRILKRGDHEAEAIVLGEGPELALHLVGAELEKACDLAGGRKVAVTQHGSGLDRRFSLNWEPPPEPG